MSRSRTRIKIDAAHAHPALTIRQRCFYLFCALLLLLVTVPLLEDSANGRIALNVISLLILLSGAGAIGHSGGALVISLLLATPAVGFQVLGFASDAQGFVILSQSFAAAFYFITVSYLLMHVLRREVLTMDKLYGAAAAYLMVGVLWAYLYSILLSFHPGALTLNGAPVNELTASTMLFFSFATLTSASSDVFAALPAARMLCAFEMIIGVLFITVLIARLAGSYEPNQRPR